MHCQYYKKPAVFNAKEAAQQIQFLRGVLDQVEEDYYKLKAKTEWIPVSERLPNKSGDYLATIPLDADETYVDVLTFHKGRFYEDDDEWGATYHDDVLAWMPLPEPYKGGGAE